MESTLTPALHARAHHGAHPSPQVMLQIDPERRADMSVVSAHPFVRENVARRATTAASTAPGTAPVANNGAAAAASRAPSPTIPRSGSASRIPAPPRRKSTTPRPPDDTGAPKDDGSKGAVTGASTDGGLEPPPLPPQPLIPSAAEAAATTTGATRPSPRCAAQKQPLRPPPVSAPLAGTSPCAAMAHGSEGSASSGHTPPSVPAITGAALPPAGPVTAPANERFVKSKSKWEAARKALPSDNPKGSLSARPKLQTPGSKFVLVAQAAAEAAKKEKARPHTARARLSAGQPSGSAKRPVVSTSGAKTAPKPPKTAPPKTTPAATPLPLALAWLPPSGMSPTAVAPAAKAAAFTAASELQRTLPPPPPEAAAAGAVAGADASMHPSWRAGAVAGADASMLPSWRGLGAGRLAILDNASGSTDGAGSTASPGTASVVSPGSVPPLTPLTPGTPGTPWTSNRDRFLAELQKAETNDKARQSSARQPPLPRRGDGIGLCSTSGSMSLSERESNHEEQDADGLGGGGSGADAPRSAAGCTLFNRV